MDRAYCNKKQEHPEPAQGIGTAEAGLCRPGILPDTQSTEEECSMLA